MTPCDVTHDCVVRIVTCCVHSLNGTHTKRPEQKSQNGTAVIVRRASLTDSIATGAVAVRFGGKNIVAVTVTEPHVSSNIKPVAQRFPTSGRDPNQGRGGSAVGSRECFMENLVIMKNKIKVCI
jgi:hypothetical protein